MSRPFVVEAEPPDLVRVWSTFRLPLESKNANSETRALQEAIAHAVRRLRASQGQVLSATYVSSCDEKADADNVLLYNVGCGNFLDAAREGLRFERVYAEPPPAPEALAGPAAHHHVYELIERRTPFRHWTKGEPAFAWEDLPIPALREGSKPDAVWLALRREAKAPDPGRIAGRYVLRLELAASEPPAIRPACVIKPIVDGVVSAFHAHAASDGHLLAERLASRLGVDAREVSELLTAQEGAVLGVRRLLWCRRDNGCQWNPKDEDCVACELLWTDAGAPGEWHLSGAIHPALPVEWPNVAGSQR